MIFLFFLLVLCFVIIKLGFILKKEQHIFFKVKKFTVKNTLLNLVNKKLKSVINIPMCLDEQIFKDLNLILAPVYVLDVKKVGITHLKIFLNAVKDIDKKFNLVLTNSDNIKVNSYGNINIVLLSSRELNYKVITFLNMINVNKEIIKYKQKLKYDYVVDDFKVDLKTMQSSKVLNKGVYKFDMPYSCFGYVVR